MISEKFPPRILIIEPDTLFVNNISNTMERYWFDVRKADNLEEAIRLVGGNIFNIVVISSGVPDISAVEMAVKIKKAIGQENIPIVFLVDPGESIENYSSVNNGLIELVYRPITQYHLISALKTLLRKSQPVFQDKVIGYGDLRMNLANYQVYRGDNKINLGPTEFKILHMFIILADRILSRKQIIEHIWSDNKPTDIRTIDVHINRIRKTLKIKGDSEPFIKTVRSKGYRLKDLPQ